MAYSPLPPMMPISAWVFDFVDFVAVFAAIFFFSSSREDRSC
jgi:hypothetical protein